MTEKELLEVIEQAAKEEATELDFSGNKLTVLPCRNWTTKQFTISLPLRQSTE